MRLEFVSRLDGLWLWISTMSNWLFQFWYFAFKSAKHWGRGPYTWSASELRFPAQQYFSPSPTLAPSPSSDRSRSPPRDRHVRRHTRVPLPMPPPLCRWSVHCHEDLVTYEQDSHHEGPDLEDREGEDADDESTWRDWPAEKREQAYHERLFEGIVANDFSNIDGSDLPIALPQVFGKQNDASFFSEESLGFAIIAGNLELTRATARRLPLDKEMRANPLHLATSYLHGSKSCCLILEALLVGGQRTDYFRQRNHLGHNLFDNLMLTILRSHTSLTPNMVDASLKGEKRFPGEEVDICGRWDADSECYRELLSSGILSVPSEWKHKFCNTSIQALCHSLTVIALKYPSIFRAKSGLFVMRCENCGLTMELTSIHVAILVALKIADFGLLKEDLLGPLAIILRIIILILEDSEISEVIHDWLPLETYCDVMLRQDDLDPARCHHKPMDAFEFASSLSQDHISRWSDEIKIGWSTISHVLRIVVQNPWVATSEDDSNGNDGGNFGEDPRRGCDEHGRTVLNSSLVKLWGAVQVEFLTYRRLAESDPWTSRNFDMRAVLKSFEEGTELSAGPITDRPLMEPLCECGLSLGASLCPEVTEVCKEYFSNLGDDYERLNVVPPPEAY